MLTPLDIQKRSFSKTINGYSPKEVEEFLTLVSATLEKHINEGFDMKERCEHLEREIVKYQAIEKTMSETLLVAKTISEELVSNAQGKAKLICDQAEQEAQQMKFQANVDIEKQRYVLEALKADFSAFKTRFLTVLRAQHEIVENYTIDIDVQK